MSEPPRSRVAEVTEAEAGELMPASAITREIVAVETGAPVPATRRHGLGPGAWLSLGWLGLLTGAALFASFLPLADPHVTNVAIARQGPSTAALLGGDANGRDVLARVIYGARASLLIGLGAIAIGLAVGGFLGVLAGYSRGRTDTVVASAFDVMLSVPALILALAFTVFLGPSVRNMILALGIVAIPQLGRVTRANALAWSQREFVLAARAQGARNTRVILRELLPNVLPATVSIALLGIAVAIVAEAGLSLLGAGVKTGTITWGTMIVGGRDDLESAPWVVLAPATALFLTVLALNYVGDVVRARFDVREAAL
jgi:peptide/nickel transport system permease protein